MTAFSTTNSRWAALQSRNSLAASAFIYSVITTKIYCRPTCPSRLARRANIIFHDTPAEAEAAGFRACKRCRPNLKENEGDPQFLAVEKACDLIMKEGSGGVKWSVKSLAKEVGLTESHFCRVFKKVMGMTIGEYRIKVKIRGGDPRDQGSNNNDGLELELQHSIVLFNEQSTRDLCPPELVQDWHNFSGLHTPEDYIPDTPALEVTNIYHYDFGFADTVEVSGDCFQFVDFNPPWEAGFS
ncbi:putative DNA repair and transcription factor Ada [Rhexocercosporidium sp. MPI-PUGE-AT-0058]|nr:putative DNA repair and transcription factor Ada [Rhexocercosporidium sp. MPI-PUGE-AT-0058]